MYYFHVAIWMRVLMYVLISLDNFVIGLVIHEMLVARAAVEVRTMEETGVKILYGASKGHFHGPQSLDV
ncbi:hypothetical protein Tco_0548707 [Tanacetum coccineum]